MALSNDLVSQFVKITNDTKKTSTETTAWGTVAKDGNNLYVILDGSDESNRTPVSTTIDVEDGERVSVLIKDHSATITGNISSPAARTDDVQKIGTKVSEFEIIIADKVSTKQLEAEVARIDKLVSDEIEAVDVKVDNLDAKVAEIDKAIIDQAQIENLVANTVDAKVADIDFVTTEQLDATNAKINNLDTTYATIERLKVTEAEVEELDVKKLDVTWANIDYANIERATLRQLHVESGLIEDLTTDNVSTTFLVGAMIKGDNIQAGTLQADKLIVLGDDGLYYKLNFESGNFTDSEEVPTDKLHGSIIAAESITADKVNISDLTAFGATIGGFHISSNSIFSGEKNSANSPISGIYIDKDGQISLGDDDNYLKYYKDENGDYRMAISLESLVFGLNSKTSGSDLANLLEHIKMGTYINPETGNDEPSIEMFEDDSDFKMRLTNTNATFTDGVTKGTKVSTDGVETDNVTIRNSLKQGGFAWIHRTNGSIKKLGLAWEGVDG